MRIICLDWPLERNAITVGKLKVCIVIILFFFLPFYFFCECFCAANIKPLRKNSHSSVWAADWQLLCCLSYCSCRGQREDVRAVRVAHVHGHFFRNSWLLVQFDSLSCVALIQTINKEVNGQHSFHLTKPAARTQCLSFFTSHTFLLLPGPMGRWRYVTF